MQASLTRAELILKLIVEHYLLDGQPVSSKFLADNAQLSVSSATVRNSMMQLEQQGLIKSPHTSAGRIPTTLGIRLFIDKMLRLQPLSGAWQNEVQRKLTSQLPVSLLCQQAGQLLANLTGLVAIVSAPKADGRFIRQMDLVRLESNRLLLVVIDEDGDILHRLLHCDNDIDNNTLNRVLYLLNAALGGGGQWQWLEVIERIANTVKNETGLCQALLQKVLGQLSLDELSQNKPLIYGQHQLLLTPEYPKSEALQNVIGMLENPEPLVRLLQHVTTDNQAKLLLGKESGFIELANVSVIVQRYQKENRFIALLGPRRMDYAKLIPLVEACAHQLNLNLNRR